MYFSSTKFNLFKIFIILSIFLNCGIFACYYNGITYRNGNEWLENNAFVMRCTINADKSWRAEVVACALPDSRRVPIQTTLEDGNFVWQCKLSDDQSIRLIQSPSQNALCNKEHPVGSVWQEKSFELECLPGGITKLLACVTDNGDKVAVNGTRFIEGFEMECKQFINGTVIFRGTKTVPRSEPIKYYSNNQPIINSQQQQYGRPIISPIIKCTDENGNIRHIGDYWTENHRFNKTCREGGAVEVVNCVSKDGYRVPLNGLLIKNGHKLECKLTPQGTIKFTSGPE